MQREPNPVALLNWACLVKDVIQQSVFVDNSSDSDEYDDIDFQPSESPVLRWFDLVFEVQAQAAVVAKLTARTIANQILAERLFPRIAG